MPSQSTYPPRRLRLDLPGSVVGALTRAAIREDRDMAAQAVRMIREGLIRRGDLSADGVTLDTDEPAIAEPVR